MHDAEVRITVGGRFHFHARFEAAKAPRTVEAFRKLLPYRQRLIQARWSGEACWIPLGDFQLGVVAENQTMEPAPGQILWYPGGVSETELLFPYGETRFASKFGPLAGNHFLTITQGAEQLGDMGRHVLEHGAQEIVFA